ncbi:hypothetical protein J437_LFUL019236 [Ladona fulva]|uniref:CCHC-type domain-containing protein n=1 Tax=Ladona fulva TaxID=123851 RepID=A0A8K0KRN1_LADFU|nr:hypothetical protein J437_LFUL019236 [Ladona fulva]
MYAAEPYGRNGIVPTPPQRISDVGPLTHPYGPRDAATNSFLSMDNHCSLINVISNESAPAVPNTQNSQPPAPPVAAPAIGNQIYFIPTFSGDDDVSVNKFLECVKITSHLSAWTEQQTLGVVRLRLEGSAAEYVQANPHVLESYELFSTSLQRRFTFKKSPHSVERMFNTCVQGNLESVNVYATRLRKIARELREISYDPRSEATRRTIDHRLLSQFLIGLREEIARFVLVRNPSSIREAEDFALLEEANSRNYALKQAEVRSMQQFPTPSAWQGISNTPQNPFLSSNGGTPPAYGQINAIQAKQQQPEVTPSPDTPRGTERRCYHCGRSDHIARFCRSRPRNCFNCGRTNHLSKECPLLLCGICKKAGHRPLDCNRNVAVPTKGNAISPTLGSGPN